MTIPQSHWVSKILPDLGGGKYFLVEIPESSRILTKAWEYIDEAERALGMWDVAAIASRCREVGDLLDRELGQKLGDSYGYKERWGRAFNLLKHLASLGLHNEDISKDYPRENVKTTRADAELLIVVTKSLVKFAEEILKETNSH